LFSQGVNTFSFSPAGTDDTYFYLSKNSFLMLFVTKVVKVIKSSQCDYCVVL